MGEASFHPLPAGERDSFAQAKQGEGPPPNNSGDMLRLARAARQEMTEAEERLWSRLRGRRLGGYKFRRQHVIGRARPDFFCAAANLVVEVDGSQHVEQAQADSRRTAKLNIRGHRVLRVWNNEVLHNVDAVLEAILAALAAPHPASAAPKLSLSPPGRG